MQIWGVSTVQLVYFVYLDELKPHYMRHGINDLGRFCIQEPKIILRWLQTRMKKNVEMKKKISEKNVQ